jgi:hypothetical protein
VIQPIFFVGTEKIAFLTSFVKITRPFIMALDETLALVLKGFRGVEPAIH